MPSSHSHDDGLLLCLHQSVFSPETAKQQKPMSAGPVSCILGGRPEKGVLPLTGIPPPPLWLNCIRLMYASQAVRTAREILEKQGGSFALVVEDDVDWETSLELWENYRSSSRGPLTLTQWAYKHTEGNNRFGMVQLQYIVGEGTLQDLESQCNEDCKRVRLRYILNPPSMMEK